MLKNLSLLSLLALTLVGCGFQLRGEAQLPPGMQRVIVVSADAFSPLKRNLEDSLRRSGATVEEKSGDGIAELKLPVVTISPEVSSVGIAQHVREFVMVYHVELEVVNSEGKIIVPKQTVELTRDFTFDDTQALGIGVEQDELKRQMQRDMVQSVMRRIEAVGKSAAAH
ncbi:LPS assembly lipoprotein LptE [Pseudolysobacter antarcticus]|nr:LPS assembly lipoprotein LptE [Pseudolysobacter antarcticus]